MGPPSVADLGGEIGSVSRGQQPPTAHSLRRPPTTALCGRALAALVFISMPFVVAEANTRHSAHRVVSLLVDYSPQRFLHGAVWTLPLSALITSTLGHVRLDIAVTILLMAPYVILAGFLRTIIRFFAGHIGCTLVTLTTIVVTSAAGWATATKLYSTHDVGVSAGAARGGRCVRRVALAYAGSLACGSCTGDPAVLLHLPHHFRASRSGTGRRRASDRRSRPALSSKESGHCARGRNG